MFNVSTLLASVATRLRCGGIFSYSTYYYKFSSDSNNKINLKNGEYYMKLKRTKLCQFFGPPCIRSLFVIYKCIVFPCFFGILYAAIDVVNDE